MRTISFYEGFKEKKPKHGDIIYYLRNSSGVYGFGPGQEEFDKITIENMDIDIARVEYSWKRNGTRKTGNKTEFVSESYGYDGEDPKEMKEKYNLRLVITLCGNKENFAFAMNENTLWNYVKDFKLLRDRGTGKRVVNKRRHG
ncbi:hypothetical protein M0R36_10980 [bacterium]|jgi:hypothetical protein|nr:hypothetical protein [bacterium]